MAVMGPDPNVPAPPRPERPTFDPDPWEVPERDVGRVEELRTKAAGPGVRGATKTMQQALLREYRNPNLARLALRDVLGGHGEALSKIYGGAARTAETQYAPEFAAEREKSRADWEVATEAEKRQYELELEEHLRELERWRKRYDRTYRG